MNDIFGFQLLLLLIIGLKVNHSTPTVKQHMVQHLKTVKSEKYSSSSVNNPYILACNSSSQCQDTILDECVIMVPDQSTWYCNCFCDGYGPCKSNRDCCNNNCINEICSHNGGEQGTVCSGSCAPCALEYVCELLPDDSDLGYCNYKGEETTHSVPETTRVVHSSSGTPGGNPWIYEGCPNGPSDCQNTYYHECVQCQIHHPNTWFCDGSCGGDYCNINKDCANNDCVNGKCSFAGGSEGTFCWMDGGCANCSQGLTCKLVCTNQGGQIVGYCG